MDTGAQIPLIGMAQLQALGEHLKKKFGVTYRWTCDKRGYTGGVGGKCELVGKVEIPMGVAGESGIKEMKVTTADISDSKEHTVEPSSIVAALTASLPSWILATVEDHMLGFPLADIATAFGVASLSNAFRSFATKQRTKISLIP